MIELSGIDNARVWRMIVGIGVAAAIALSGVVTYTTLFPMLEQAVEYSAEEAKNQELVEIFREIHADVIKDDFTVAPLEVQTAPTLNLSLPTMEWSKYRLQEQSGDMPDYFHLPKSQNRVNVSGTLFIDDSEEAKDLPIQETIKGGEIQLRVLIP